MEAASWSGQQLRTGNAAARGGPEPAERSLHYPVSYFSQSQSTPWLTGCRVGSAGQSEPSAVGQYLPSFIAVEEVTIFPVQSRHYEHKDNS